LLAELVVPLRAVAPGQMFVMYDGDVCLGSATIVAHGPTLAEGSAAAPA
jgi:tRNA U34 2-thiouridine synthase MnmA/TrmU